jgi:pimeloyl-ACP methyl ester carboxylesterase
MHVILAHLPAVEEHTIEPDTAPVFYRSAPGETPPVLYLHGMPTSSEDFDELLSRTGGLAPDLPGFGRSTKAEHLRYTIDAHATFINQFLRRLEVDRVKLVAHGWGAGGGLVFAQRQPERVERLVLIDALPLFSGIRWSRLAVALRTPLLGELVMGAVSRRRFERMLQEAALAGLSEQRLERAWKMFDQGTQRAVLRMLRDAAAGGGRRLEQAGADLDRLDVPALIVWGEGDPWWPPRYAERYASALPRPRLRLVAGAGHWPWFGNAGLADEIIEFLT